MISARTHAARALQADSISIAVGSAVTGIPLVTDVSLEVVRGQMTAVIGESGSGKSLTASALIGLLDPKIFRVSTKRLVIDGIDLQGAAESRFAEVRGSTVGYVMQDPSTALDPTMIVGKQLAEVFVVHRGMSYASAWAEAVRMLDLVRIPGAARRALDYPQSFSGGMKQRVVIAGAVALSPSLLIADEPTTALDVTVQAEVLALIDELRRTMGMGVLLITHDLGVVYQLADQVTVMYAGRVVEEGPADRICTTPAHPYTRGLLDSVPDLEGTRGATAAIPGAPPVIGRPIAGCAFAPRCNRRIPASLQSMPSLSLVGPGHSVRCVNPLSGQA